MATPAVQAQSWATPVLRGVLAVLFGLALLIWPGYALFTLQVLIVLFGAYALIDGILAIIATVRAFQQHTQWWPKLLEGVLGITAAALVFFWPSITATVLIYVIAAWAVFTGFLKMVSAFPRRDWLLVAGGAVSFIFGLVLAAYAGAAIETVIWIIGVFAIIFGALLIGQGLQLASRPAGQQ